MDAKNNSTVIRFPIRRFPGFHRKCIQCRHPYRLPWMAATITDGRTHFCPPCYIHTLKVRNGYAPTQTATVRNGYAPGGE